MPGSVKILHNNNRTWRWQKKKKKKKKKNQKKTTTSLQKHAKYMENLTSKNWKFSDKNSDIFSYFCLKHRLWVLDRTTLARRFWRAPQSIFLSRNKKNNVYPCKPQFYCIKVGFKGGGGQKYIGIFRDVHCSHWRHVLWLPICFPAYQSLHYENMPIQICWKFYHQKMKIFR